RGRDRRDRHLHADRDRHRVPQCDAARARFRERGSKHRGVRPQPRGPALRGDPEAVWRPLQPDGDHAAGAQGREAEDRPRIRAVRGHRPPAARAPRLGGELPAALQGRPFPRRPPSGEHHRDGRQPDRPARLRTGRTPHQADAGVDDRAGARDLAARPGHRRATALQGRRRRPTDQPPPLPAGDPRHPRALPGAQTVGGRPRRVDEGAGRSGDEVQDQDSQGVRRPLQGLCDHGGNRAAARSGARRQPGGPTLREAASLRPLQPRFDERRILARAPAAAGLSSGHAAAARAYPDGSGARQVQRERPQRRALPPEHEREGARHPPLHRDARLWLDRRCVLARRTRVGRRRSDGLAAGGVDRVVAGGDAVRSRAQLDPSQRTGEEDQLAPLLEVTSSAGRASTTSSAEGGGSGGASGAISPSVSAARAAKAPILPTSSQPNIAAPARAMAAWGARASTWSRGLNDPADKRPASDAAAAPTISSRPANTTVITAEAPSRAPSNEAPLAKATVAESPNAATRTMIRRASTSSRNVPATATAPVSAAAANSPFEGRTTSAGAVKIIAASQASVKRIEIPQPRTPATSVR